MYGIYADDTCIYNDRYITEETTVIEPKLVMEDNSAGSFTVTIPPSNVGYNTITRMITDISIRKEGDDLWSGRVLSESKDFWNNRVLYCEGELAFLNDSTQPPAEYHNQTVRGFLETLISIHNSKVADNRRFTVGVVTVTDPNDSLYRYTNFEKTIECINDKLLERLGGHIRVRKEAGVRYLDYLAEYPRTNSQIIEFGKNLMDFTREWDSSEFATVIVPLGNRLEESPIEALDAYLTVESVNNGSIYVQSSDAVEEYGWIEKVVNWDDVSTASALLSKARTYLSAVQFENMKLELNALDLHYHNVNYEAIHILDLVRAKSIPHGMDRYFPVTKLEIPLDEPENTRFSLGDTVKKTLTSVNNQINSGILRRIENLPSSLLAEARRNATAIMNMATSGYVTIVQDAENGAEALYISDTPDYALANRLWKWSMSGLGYSSDGGNTFELAMTMDGSFVADFITTGTLNADIIRTGVLRDNGMNVEFDLTTGTLTMNKGSINLGNGKFMVTDEGVVTATSGTFGGWTLGPNGLSTTNGKGVIFDSETGAISVGTLNLEPSQHSDGNVTLLNKSDADFWIASGGLILLGHAWEANNRWSALSNILIDPHRGAISLSSINVESLTVSSVGEFLSNNGIIRGTTSVTLSATDPTTSDRINLANSSSYKIIACPNIDTGRQICTWSVCNRDSNGFVVSCSPAFDSWFDDYTVGFDWIAILD